MSDDSHGPGNVTEGMNPQDRRVSTEYGPVATELTARSGVAVPSVTAPNAAFVPDLALLSAAEEAADDDGWATADEIRFILDGATARGRWARTLHAHADAGYLERAGISGPYALTEKGCEALYA